MNIPVIFSKILCGAKNIGGKTLLVARKHAPEICIGAGIVGFGGTVAATVKATNTTHDILDEREKMLAVCDREMRENPEGYSREIYESDLKVIRKKTRRKLIRTWLPVGTLGGASVVSVLGGYKILNGRYVATTAAYKALESWTERYRGNVISRFGKDVDLEMQRLKAEEISENREARQEAEEAEKQKIKKRPRCAWEKCGSIMIFDDHSDHWQRYWTPDMVFQYLRTKQNQLNDMLKIRGHLFVNEVNDALGFERTAEGQVIGWYYDKRNSPNSYVDFGLDDMPEEQIREIMAADRNCDIRVPIYLNPEGIVFDLIGKHEDI